MSKLDGPRFIVTVDTEEEFDWRAPFSRDGYATSHLKAVPRFQDFCSGHGVAPCYLVDFPITEDAFGAELLGNYARAGDAEIGVQLHPWVNPPFDEAVSLHNSYACNLPEPLERAKLTALHEAIVNRFGVQPDAYRAGRYGAGKDTAAILDDLGMMQSIARCVPTSTIPIRAGPIIHVTRWHPIGCDVIAYWNCH